MTTEVHCFCRICAAACGIVVTLDGEQVVRVRGDADHPVSRGYTCAKGRGLAEWHHSAARLDRPRLGTTETDWPTVLDHLAGRLATISAESGADAIGLYLATGLAYDSAGQVVASQFLPAIGSQSFFTAVTVDNAPVLVAAELVAGQPMLNPVWDPDQPGLLVVIGTNPVVSHGYGTAFADPVRHLRDYRDRGGEIWVLDPRRTETAVLADRYLRIRPGTDIAVLGAIAAALLADGVDPVELRDHCDPEDLDTLRRALVGFTVAAAARTAAVSETEITTLIDAIRAHSGRIAVMCGTGVTMARDGIVAEWLRWVILILSGSVDREGGMRCNRGLINRLRPPRPGRATAPTPPGPRSRPELPRVLGQLPAVSMVDEIEAGRLRALVVTGGNPLTAFPQPDRVRAALARLDVLAVVDVADNELGAMATHVLPATGQLERADLTLAELTAVRSGMQYTAAVVPSAPGRRPAWWILASVAQRLGHNLLGGATPDDLTDTDILQGLLARSPIPASAVLAAGPHGVDVPHEFGWVHDELLPDRRWHVAPPVMIERLAAWELSTNELVLTPHRTMAWSNSVRYGPDPADAAVYLHPDDADRRDLETGDLVKITSRYGTIRARAERDDRIAPGCVSLSHGHPARNVGALVGTDADIDPLTAMPRASGVTVTITAAPDIDAS